MELYWSLCGHGLRLSGKDSYFILAVMSIVLGLGFWQKYSWGIFNRRGTQMNLDGGRVQSEFGWLIRLKFMQINSDYNYDRSCDR
ncbi:hypothetical protein [Microcoleus sp. Pol7_B2]|uniref:hypothetical protein n=1 Tax=Microcoleus sp. Pol7_B2 TaxID=2818895 RepID=UPI002FCF3BE8